jgi:hypothetical protein
VAGTPLAGKIDSNSWISKIQWTSQQVSPGVTVRSGTLSDSSAKPDYSDGPHGIEGYRVRTGDFTTESAATSLATTLKGLGFTTAAVEWTGCDRDQAPDSEAIHAVARAQVVTAATQELGAEIVTDGGWGDPSAINHRGVPYSVGVYDGPLDRQRTSHPRPPRTQPHRITGE